MDKKKVAGELRSMLPQFTGTTTWYRHPQFKRFTYTEGVQYLAETAQAYWLLDVIFSHQLDKKVSAQEFQTWELTINPDHTGLVTCTDGGRNGGKPRELTRQEIPFTDFPLPEIRFFLEGTVLLLPSEH